MLHEASSIAKAVEKAWTDAGKPTEFTIKVLEVGEKNFFGMSKSPAIVSITYAAHKSGRQQDSGKPHERRTADLNAKNAPAQRTILGTKTQNKPLAKKEPVKPAQLKPAQATEAVKEKRDPEQIEWTIWQDEMVAFVAKELKELLALWGTKPEFSTKIDKKTLMITLENRLHEDTMEERNVFMSFSYLLIQLLKRNYKKKFRGFQLIITTPKSTL